MFIAAYLTVNIDGPRCTVICMRCSSKLTVPYLDHLTSSSICRREKLSGMTRSGDIVTVERFLKSVSQSDTSICAMISSLSLI